MAAIKRIVIVGAGAIGGYIGARLYESGFPVLLVARGQHARVIESRGLTVNTPQGSSSLLVPCRNGLDQVKWREGDTAICAVKSQHAEQVLDELLGLAGPALPVVCASNGMHNEVWASARFNDVVSMLVWLPATYLEPGVISNYSAGCPGVLDVGVTQGEVAPGVATELGALLCKAGFSSEVREDIKSWKFAKWITNLGNTAQALITGDWLAVAEAARAEGEAVLTEASVDRISTARLTERCKDVRQVSIAGERRSGGSTWQSFTRGKSLETPYLEGAMVDMAARTNAAVPVNTLLTELAQVRESLTSNEFFARINARQAE